MALSPLWPAALQAQGLRRPRATWCLAVPGHGDTAQLGGGREGEREIPTEPSTAQALGQAEVCVQQELLFVFFFFYVGSGF